MGRVCFEMSNIKAFKNNIPPGEPNHELVGRLKILVAEAESGGLRALAFGGVRLGSMPFTEWVTDPSDWSALCMSVLSLHYRVSKATDGDGDD